MKLKYLWILIIIILLSNIILAEQEITSINNKYVYNKAPDSFPLGSKICFSQEDNRICAPLINFNVQENQIAQSININLENEVNINGRACIVGEITSPSWIQIMNNLGTTCVNFNTNNNLINFNFNYAIDNSILRIVLIPESGEGDANILNAVLTVGGAIEPEPIPIPEPEPTPIPEPTPEPIEYQELTKCNIESINFDKTESSTKIPSNLIVKTNNCDNSIIKIQILKKTIGYDSVISEKQTTINNEETKILWVSEDPGTYYASAESENIMVSNIIEIKEFNIEDMKENKKFYEVINEIHQIAQVDKKTAKQVCEDMETSIETDACLEDLASYTKDKRLCAGIENSNKKESCYTMFALEGDISGCIHSGSKGMCIMLGMLTRTNDFNFTNHEDQYEEAIIMKQKKSNNLLTIIIILVIIAGLFYAITEIINKKIHKEKKRKK